MRVSGEAPSDIQCHWRAFRELHDVSPVIALREQEDEQNVSQKQARTVTERDRITLLCQHDVVDNQRVLAANTLSIEADRVRVEDDRSMSS